MADRLTDKLVRDFPPPASGNKIHYDGDVRGFGVRITSAGARSWVFNYRAGGVERRLTIGDTKAWTVRAARGKANELRRLVDDGLDPMAVRHAQRRRQPWRTSPSNIWTMSRFENDRVRLLMTGR